MYSFRVALAYLTHVFDIGCAGPASVGNGRTQSLMWATDMEELFTALHLLQVPASGGKKEKSPSVAWRLLISVLRRC